MRISPPSISIPESIDGFEACRQRLLEATAGADLSDDDLRDPKQDLYGNRAIANLLIGRYLEACNDSLTHVAQWFDHPHPNGRRHDGECDFAAMKLCRASYLFASSDRLLPETRERIQRFFLTTEFKSCHPSENHELLFRTSRYLMGRFFPDQSFEAYGQTGAALAEEDGDWLTSFIRYRGKRAWGEFDSSCYFIPDWECLISLHDFCSSAPAVTSADSVLPDLVKQMMNVLLHDMVVGSQNGVYGGAHGRIYEPHATDHRTTGTYALQYLYFGNADPDAIPGGILVDALSSAFRPDEITIDIALNRTLPYINRERKHLHNCSDVRSVTPVDGSIRKYTYVDTDLGCALYDSPYLKSEGDSGEAVATMNSETRTLRFI